MKLIYFVSIFLYVAPPSMGSEVIIANIGDEILFEERTLILRCQSHLKSLSWWKGSSKMAEINNGILTVEPLYEHLEFSHQFIFFIVKFPSLKVIDTGSYTCRGHVNEGTVNATVNFKVYDKDQCVTNLEGPQEYLNGDMMQTLFVKCNYPVNTSIDYTSLWYDMNSIQLNTITSSTTDLTYTTTAVYSIPEGQNGSVVTCYVKEAGGLPPGPSSNIFSCSVGPIYFFDIPFILIETVHNGDVGEMEEITLSCRLVPSSIMTELIWGIPPTAQRSTINESGGISYLTLSNFEPGLHKTVTTNCTAVALGKTYTSSYCFVVRRATTTVTPKDNKRHTTHLFLKSFNSTEFVSGPVTTPESEADHVNASNDPNKIPKDDDANSLILVIVVLSVVVAVLLGLLFQIAIWCLIRKKDTSKTLGITKGAKRSSIYTNEGFNEDGIYNDIASLPTSSKLNRLPSERCVEIKDDEESCDETLEDIPKLNFQRPSSVSTFSDVSSLTAASHSQLPSYTSVVHNESQYDLPPFNTCPIYATACKKERRTSTSSHSRRMISSFSNQLSQQGDSSDESGVSVSFNKSSEEYFELNEEPILSTKC